jgi:hypothetical protein
MEVSCQFHAPAALPPGNEPTVAIEQEGDWVGSKAGLDDVEKRKISISCRELNAGRPACRYAGSCLK